MVPRIILVLIESTRHVERPRGRPQTTWLQCVKKQLSEINIKWENAQDRQRGLFFRKRWLRS